MLGEGVTCGGWFVSCCLRQPSSPFCPCSRTRGCRWVCPTGTCADVAAHAGVRLRRRLPRIFPLGQWIAFLTLGGAILGYPVLLWLDPLALFSGLCGITHAWLPSVTWWCALGMVGILVAVCQNECANRFWLFVKNNTVNNICQSIWNGPSRRAIVTLETRWYTSLFGKHSVLVHRLAPRPEESRACQRTPTRLLSPLATVVHVLDLPTEPQ